MKQTIDYAALNKNSKPMHDARIERYLKSMGVKWEFGMVPLVEVRDDLANVRGDGAELIDANLENITRAIRESVLLPPLLTIKHNGKEITADGHHRKHSLLKAGCSCFARYLVFGVSDNERLKIQTTANLFLNGADVLNNKTDLAFRNIWAGSMELKEAAEIFSVSEGRLRERLRGAETRQSLLRAGYDFKRKPLSEWKIEQLHKIRERTPALLGAAHLMFDATMTREDAALLVQQLQDAPDDAAVASILAKERNLRARRPRVRGTTQLLTRMNDTLTRIKKVFREKKAVRKIMSDLRPQQREDLMVEIRQCAEVLGDVYETHTGKTS